MALRLKLFDKAKPRTPWVWRERASPDGIVRAEIAEPQNPLARALSAGLKRALSDTAPLPEALLRMEGMSGARYRAMINTIVAETPSPRYLEVGSWAGSTLCAAIAGNAVDALAIDNWSQFGGPAQDFFRNVSAYIGPETRVSVLSQDFRATRFEVFGPRNLYLFDGPHAYQDQYDGVVLAQPALAREHILIVDDWNWDAVRRGTRDAIRDQRLVVLAEIEIRTTLDETEPAVCHQDSQWHNGYCFFALRKPEEGAA